jgi:predicted metal-dependent phosphoesterase TrpH
MHKIDLHIHSHYSDGKSSCENLIELAYKKKLEIISITDHDTLEGTEESIETARKYSIPYICGVEISTNVEDMLHILGYGINYKDEKFRKFVNFCQKKRFDRIKNIIYALDKHGIDIKLGEVLDLVKSSPSRVHIADILTEKDYAFSRAEAFKKFLLPSSPTYVRPCGVGVKQALHAINQAGGIAVLAHPGVIKTSYDISEWISLGLKGIEAFYPKHSKTETEKYTDLADKYDLIATAGTDFHGPDRGFSESLGIEISQTVFKTIKNKFFRNGAGN